MIIDGFEIKMRGRTVVHIKTKIEFYYSIGDYIEPFGDPERMKAHKAWNKSEARKYVQAIYALKNQSNFTQEEQSKLIEHLTT